MKSYDITIDLKQKIVNGAYKPGAPIPRREELLNCYDASKGTVQSAINQLIEEGFLEAHGAKGMFVSNNPPHLYKIGITIPKQVRGTDSIDLFWRNILKEASKLEKSESGYSFKFYHGIGMDEAANDWETLFKDIENHTISGLILIEHWRLPEVTFYELSKKIPLVIFEHEEMPRTNVYSVWFNYNHMIDMALERFHAMGTKKIASITNAELPPDYTFHYMNELKKRGMYYSDELVQGIALGHYEQFWTERIAKLLFSRGEENPDGLLILNQNLIPFVLKALREIGKIPGRDLQVIAHSDFPLQTPRYEGVELVGFNDSEALMKSIELLNKHRQGILSAPKLMLDAYWDTRS